jgi:MFS family permease
MSSLRFAAGDTFRSLRIRNFRLFFSGQLISQTGTWLTMVAQTLLVLKLTDSGVLLGLLTACMFGPVLLIGPWAGMIADRSDKRRLLLITQTAAMAESFVLAIVVFSGQAAVWNIFLLAGVQGVITAFDNPARRAFVVEMVPREDQPNAVSLNTAVMTGSRVVGPAAAGALVITVGFGWAFLLDGFSYLAVIWGLWAMHPAELFSSAPAKKAKGQVREGLRYVFARRDLFVPLVMMAIIGTLAFNFNVTIPLMVKGPLGGGDGTFTLLFSVVSIGSVVGALATARRKVVTSKQLVISATIFGVAMLAFACAPGLPVAFPVSVFVGLGSIVFMTSSTAIVQMLAAPEYRGRVLALQAMVFLGSTPIGGPIVGWISDTFGPRWGVAVGGFGCLGAAAWGYWAFKKPEGAGATADRADAQAKADADADAVAEAEALVEAGVFDDSTVVLAD